MAIIRLRNCVQSITRLMDRSGEDPQEIISAGQDILGSLISSDDWLPEFASQPDDKFYRQYLLHCDPLERFSIVSFVWGPGQQTPIHDHTVWGLIGMLRGRELSKRFEKTATGLVAADESELLRGEIDVVSPTHGDIHQVKNAFEDSPSISIHVYGANIAATPRNVYDPETGNAKPFISKYSNEVLPNIW